MSKNKNNRTELADLPDSDKNIQQEKPVRKCKKAALFLAGLSLAALALALYSQYSLYELKQNLTHQQNYWTTQFGQQKTAFDQQVSTRLNAFKAQQNILEQNLKQTDARLKSELTQRQYKTNDWLLLKVRYYIELAQINAHWDNDNDSVAALLAEADELLNGMAEQNVLSLRQVLAQQISDIKSLPKIDIAGLLSQLDAAQDVVSTMPIKSFENNSPENPVTQGEQSAWRSRLNQSLNLLERLVIIRRNDEDVKPLLSPMQQAVIRESIKLNLQQAQWAILQSNQGVYDQALNESLDKIVRIFGNDTASSKALIEQLNQLKTIKLERKKPVLDDALQRINQLIDQSSTIPLNEGQQ